MVWFHQATSHFQDQYCLPIKLFDGILTNWIDKLNSKWQQLLFLLNCIKHRTAIYCVQASFKKWFPKITTKRCTEQFLESSHTHPPERSHRPQLRVPIDNNGVMVYIIMDDGTMGQAAKSQSSLPHYQSDATLKLPLHNPKSTKDFPPMYNVKVTATSCVIHGGRDQMDQFKTIMSMICINNWDFGPVSLRAVNTDLWRHLDVFNESCVENHHKILHMSRQHCCRPCTIFFVNIILVF